MNKKITLLSALILGISVGYGQIQDIELPSKQAVKSLRTDFNSLQNKTIVNANPTKALGDTAWANYFDNPSEWTATGASPNYNENGWSIVSSINAWAFNPGDMGTSGMFANFKNGDPNNFPTVMSGPFTLEYNNTIDLTGKVAPFLEFEQYGARFITKQAIQISIDGGSTWLSVASNDDITPFSGSGGSIYDKPMTRRFSIASSIAANPSNVKIRLFWDGAMNGGSMNYIAYGWFVDNVRIMEGYTDDISMLYTLDFTGTQGLHYTKIPIGQTVGVETGFAAKVQNVGVNTQDALLNVSATGYNGFSSTTTSIVAGNKDSLYIDATNGFTIPTTVGTYDFTYIVNSTNHTLQALNDDTMRTSLEVTDSIYATDGYNGSPSSMTGSFTGWASGSGDPAIGTMFEIFNNASFQHVQVGIANIPAASQANYVGNLYHAFVYKYDGATFNMIASSSDQVLASGDFGQLVDVTFPSSISVSAGDVIMVVAGSYLGAEIPIAFSGVNVAGQTVGLQGPSIITLLPTKNEGNSVDAPVVRVKFGDFDEIVNITPIATQNLIENQSGTQLTVSEAPTADSREWKWTTTSGSGYTSFATAEIGTTYTPQFATAGTYYVVCQSTFGAQTITSNEVQINVSVNNNSISPTAIQQLIENQSGTQLSVAEIPSAAVSREWKWTTTSGSGYASFTTAETGLNYTPMFATAGTYYVVCVSDFGGGDIQTSNEVQINVNTFTNTIVPAATQNIVENVAGTQLTVSETPTADSREWKYSTTSGSGYVSFATAETGTTYTPLFATAGTYYVVCESTLSGQTITSNEVQINVVSATSNTVTVAPDSTQYLDENEAGTTITATELPNAADSREWKWTTTSGSGYASFTPAETTTTYTPQFATAGTYYVVCVSDFAGDVVTSAEVTIIVTDVTGIEENTLANILVYSANNQLNVDLSGIDLKNANIQVVNMAGKVIATQSLNNGQMNHIDMAVPTGIYFFSISNGSQLFHGKVFVK